MRFLFRSLAGLFLLALTMGLLAYAGYTVFSAMQERMARESSRPAPRERVAAVNIVTVTLQEVRPVMTSFGEIRSRRTLDLRARASGTLIELAEGFEEGGRVEAGQLLARIDPTDAEAALAVARADLAEAEAAVAEAERALDIARDDLAAAQEQADLRQAAFNRAVDLRDRGVGTAAAVETAELALASARQAVLSRRQALANAESALERARTTLARQQINLAEAERALEQTRIHADFAGTLAEVSATRGSLVATNERLAQIIDTSQLEVRFRVSTPQYARLIDDRGRLRQADVTVVMDLMGVDLRAEGTITREAPTVGEGQTGRILFARLAEPGGFRPGDFVEVRITEAPLADAAVLPATALGSDGTVLVVGPEDRLSAVPVTVLRRQGDSVIVDGTGLQGLRVVAERTPLLGEGIRVRPIVPRDSPDAGQAAAEEMITLTEERRARLIAFVESNQFMPDDAKARILTQLNQPQVPARIVERLESRMGG